MKTTKLMTAFALSAMFAACSQDAELNEAIVKNDFSNIPVVEAEFTVNTGVDSRMATKFDWEVGDKVGFAWLGTTPLELTGAAYQNHPLFCIDAENKAFNTETMLYIGKYFAYMPYTAGTHSIEEIKFNVTGQPLTTNSNDLAKHTIYISPKVYELEKKQGTAADNKDKLASGMGNNLALNIARVSNAATINLTFANASALTDLKVYGVTLKNENLVSKFTYAPKGTVSAEAWKDNLEAFKNNYSATEKGEISATCKEGIAVTNNALTVYMLTMADEIPADLEVVISTNYGDVTVSDESKYGKYSDPCITFNNNNTLATTDLFDNLASAGTMNVYVDMDGKEVGNGVVKSQGDLMRALDLLVVSGYKSEVEFTIKPETVNRDKNYTFTDFTLPAGLKAPIVLKAASELENGLVFAGNTVINKNFTLAANAEVEGTMEVKLLTNSNNQAIQTLAVADGYTLTINPAAVLTNNGMIAGEGSIDLAKKTSTKVAGKYVSNNAKATASNVNNTYGQIQWIAGKVPTTEGLIYAEVYDFATLTKASDAEVTTARFVEETTFTNAGLNLNAGEFANIEYIEIYAPVTINVTKNTVTGKETIIQFSGLAEGKSFMVKQNASLTIVSDKPENAIVFGSEDNVELNVAKNAVLDLTKITFNGLARIKNEGGNVKTTNSTVNCTVVGSSNSDFN